MTRLPAGSSFFSNPLEAVSSRRTRQNPPAVLAPVTISASGEDDFELGGEFFDVYIRAGERVLGFCVGGLVVAAIWMLVAAL